MNCFANNRLIRSGLTLVYRHVCKHYHQMKTSNVSHCRYLCQQNQRFITLNSNNNDKNETIIERNSKTKKLSDNSKAEEKIQIIFFTNDGKRVTGFGKQNDSLLDVIINNDIDLDGFGACEGTLACSTCHLIFNKDDFSRIANKATDEELDMLDLAYDLTDTSRLGCQVQLKEWMNGIEVKVPASVNDVRSS
ncbi:adrenodoxin-like protein 2, mitochondrial [Oppia nitens]|uniref:adrenodoxin-like protein 2, mitochondrial n=1 Tax=Oppia nitens TaxID=1686743 RepID=UPI0023DC5AE3|nr:adrenodoxin-like protein 2, mitochondrial [Oppia nitens]